MRRRGLGRNKGWKGRKKGRREGEKKGRREGEKKGRREEGREAEGDREREGGRGGELVSFAKGKS